MGGFRVLLDWFAYLGQTLGLATTSLAARVALAALLGAAGIDKLRHPRIAAVAAINFRVIPRPWKAFGTLIGLGESAIAAAQLVPVDAVAAAGAVAAGCLSLGYVFVLGRALLAGRRFPCDCLPGLVGNEGADRHEQRQSRQRARNPRRPQQRQRQQQIAQRGQLPGQPAEPPEPGMRRDIRHPRGDVALRPARRAGQQQRRHAEHRQPMQNEGGEQRAFQPAPGTRFDDAGDE